MFFDVSATINSRIIGASQENRGRAYLFKD
jgi:hypothetical protein